MDRLVTFRHPNLNASGEKKTGFVHTQIFVCVYIYIGVCVCACVYVYIVYILIIHTIYTVCVYIYTHIVYMNAPAAAKSLQSCPTLCDPRDGSPPGSPVPGILQARTLLWVAIAFSHGWKWKVRVKSLSRVRLLATPWAAAYQAPLPMGFSRQEYWSRLLCPPPGNLPNPRVEGRFF